MKKIIVALLSFVFVSAQAQTADEVIQKYGNAMGGLDAFNKVKTAKMTATLTSQGKDLPLVIQIVNGKDMRTDVQVNGQTVVNVYNNGTGWKLNPYAGAPTATEATPGELTSFKLQANLTNNLMDYKSRGHQVELMGQEDIETGKAFKIKLTSKDDGKVTIYYVNATTYLLEKSTSTREISGNEYPVESFYSDFKEVNGLKFCTHFVQKVQGNPFQDVKYTKIELNVPVDEKIFAMPK